MFYLRTFMLSSLLLASAVAAFAQVNQSPDAAVTISISAEGIRFAALRSVGELRLEVFNSLGETVFTQLITPLASEAALDWNLRAGDGEPLTAGLYSYVLTLKSGTEHTREHRGNLIIERDQQQVWLTAQDGATVSGTFTRSGESSLAGFRTTEDSPVKRDVSGRAVVVEKLPADKDSTKAVKQEKAALTGTANMVAKYDVGGVNLIDSAITETGGNVGIGTTTPGSILEMVRPGATDVVFRMANATRAWSVGVSGTGDFWRIRDNTSGAARFAISGTGNVGIGTTAPQVKLDVVGDLQVTGNAVVSGNIAAKYQDVAEWVPARQNLMAGTVVSLDATRNNAVVPSARAYDTHVAGVVSAQPGVILGESGEGKAMVATTGRVKVKVDATRRPIKIGDLLVTSGKSGLAMKSQPLNIGGRGGARLHRPGTIIGKALEPLAKGRGEILVLLSLQ